MSVINHKFFFSFALDISRLIDISLTVNFPLVVFSYLPPYFFQFNLAPAFIMVTHSSKRRSELSKTHCAKELYVHFISCFQCTIEKYTTINLSLNKCIFCWTVASYFNNTTHRINFSLRHFGTNTHLHTHLIYLMFCKFVYQDTHSQFVSVTVNKDHGVSPLIHAPHPIIFFLPMEVREDWKTEHSSAHSNTKFQ